MNEKQHLVDPAWIDSIYAELTSMEVPLDADPLTHGPKRLNAKIAECRGFLSRSERIFTEVGQHLHRAKRQQRHKAQELDFLIQDLIANDPEVRAGSSIKDREARARYKLASQQQELFRVEDAIAELEAVHKVITVKRGDLRDTQGRIRDQIKVCQEELHIGGRWGGTDTAPTFELEPGQGVAQGSDHESVDVLCNDLDEAFGSSSDPHLEVAQEKAPLIALDSDLVNEDADVELGSSTDVDDFLDSAWSS
jgi:hypothetical protein